MFTRYLAMKLSPANAISGQHWENYDVKRAGIQFTVTREMLNAVSRDQVVPDVLAGISARFSKFCSVLLLKKITSIPSVSFDFVSGNIKMRFSENKFHCFTRDQSLTVNC